MEEKAAASFPPPSLGQILPHDCPQLTSAAAIAASLLYMLWNLNFCQWLVFRRSKVQWNKYESQNWFQFNLNQSQLRKEKKKAVSDRQDFLKCCSSLIIIWVSSPGKCCIFVWSASRLYRSIHWSLSLSVCLFSAFKCLTENWTQSLLKTSTNT